MVNSVNEYEIIRILLEVLGQPKGIYSNIGDDVAYFPVEKGKLVVKCDMLVRKTDVPRGMSLWQAARKSIVMCVSDFAVKGVKPMAALISIGIPRNFTMNEIKELAKGFKMAKEEYSIEIIGGDTNEADDLIIDCIMLGFAERVVPRSGAKPGDVVISSGAFGYPPLGLKILLEGLKVDPSIRDQAISSVLMPKARLDLGIRLSNILSASIDSSDGLAISLYEIAQQSNVGIVIDRLPTTDSIIQFSVKHGIDVEELILYGGEEYEIVATLPKDRVDEAMLIARDLSIQLTEIGRVIEGPPNVFLVSEKGVKPVLRKGWIHLA
ncbi:MAG: thiamine-phosphate kinase [Nitrososphaerota archaeon]|nr:thiamine-phosphate kinase [Nitrososphaerales archaeon]MDW8044629.1 thiamine-phosphate kinase [Nitrososphaerota archaeon]